MTAGREGWRRSGKGRGCRWETAAGDRLKGSRAARLSAGGRGDAAGGRERKSAHHRPPQTGFIGDVINL